MSAYNVGLVLPCTGYMCVCATMVCIWEPVLLGACHVVKRPLVAHGYNFVSPNSTSAIFLLDALELH